MPIWDIALGAVILLVTIFSLTQRVLRQLMTMVGFYLATVVAGIAYPYLATFMTGITERYLLMRQTIGFALVFIVVVIIVEVFHRKGFPDTNLVKLKVLDNLLAIVPGILSAFILAALILTLAGHAGFVSQERAEEFILYPFLSQFMNIYTILLRFMFVGGLPIALRFLLPDENEL